MREGWGAERTEGSIDPNDGIKMCRDQAGETLVHAEPTHETRDKFVGAMPELNFATKFEWVHGESSCIE